MKLSVVLAIRNEESNLPSCLESVKDLADEIIVFDEQSSDKSVEIAKKYGAKVSIVAHQDNFHITKQKAIDAATGDWILQLDADERVTPELAKEIKKVVLMDLDISCHPEYFKNGVILPFTNHQPLNTRHLSLFSRHQSLIEKREGKLGKQTGEVVAFFIPRRNLFLGKPLIHAGVYPDGVIRLIKKGKARLPGKSVHELMEVDGEVGWLFNDLIHNDSPTLSKYLNRMNRYTDLHAGQLKEKKVSRNALFLIHYSLFKPLFIFLKLFFIHKGFLDGMCGFLWSSFSALHFPLAYFKYLIDLKK